MPLSHQSIVAVNLPGPGIVAGEGGGFVIVFLLKWLTMSKTLSLSTGTNIRTFLQFHQIVNLFLRRQILNFYVCFHWYMEFGSFEAGGLWTELCI
jgi:hypothetical protein